jgi:hypothetical protein
VDWIDRLEKVIHTPLQTTRFKSTVVSVAVGVDHIFHVSTVRSVTASGKKKKEEEKGLRKKCCFKVIFITTNNTALQQASISYF